MVRISLIIIFYICTVFNLSAAFTLVSNGHSSGAIIIPDNPNSVELSAAKELQYHLQKATEIRLPIIREKEITEKITGGYLLGNTQKAKEQKIDISQAPPNSYTLHYDKNFLYIKGSDGQGKETNSNTAAGTLFGVYRYLQKALKICWLWPGKAGEYIPEVKEVCLDNKLDGTYLPEFKFVRASALTRNKESYRWGRRVMHISLTEYIKHAGSSGHAFKDWARLYGKKHPEWFAMLPAGKRNVRPYASMCVSNEDFQKQIVKLWHSEQIRKHDNKLFINVKENDTQARCTCPKCRSWDGPDKRGPTARYKQYRNVSERYAEFYKKVRKKAIRIDPEAKISFYAYQSYFYAPRKTKLNPNFYVGLVPDIPFPRLPEYNKWLNDEYQAWKASGASLYLRPNYFYGGYCMPEVWYDQYASEFKLLKKLGCIGVVIDGPSQMWATRSLDYYVMGRLCAEPESDAVVFVNEFLSGFGNAAPEIKAYFEHWRRYMHENSRRINDIYEKSVRGWYFHGFHYPAYAHKIFPVDELEKGRGYLERAAQAVKDNHKAAVKVDFLRQGLEYAIASSRCAEIVTSTQSSTDQKRKAWDDLLELRKKLPPHAVNPKFLDRVEKNVWTFIDKPHGDCQELPEIWMTKADPQNSGEKSGYYNVKINPEGWRKTSTWKSLKAQKHHGYGNMWYRTSVYIPEKSSRLTILHLGAIDESCKVWVNGNYVGGFEYNAKTNPDSWKKPFEVDISKWINFGHENVLCIKVTKNNEGAGGLWKPSYIVYKK
jgi:hypothetical protein